MSAEGLRPRGEDRQASLDSPLFPLKKEAVDKVLEEAQAPEFYPLFYRVHNQFEKNVAGLGKTIDFFTNNPEFPELQNIEDLRAFYEGAYLAKKLLDADASEKGRKLPPITQCAAEEYCYQGDARRETKKLSPREDWLEQYIELSEDNYEADMAGGKVLDIALERENTDEFLGGFVTVLGLYKKAEEIHEMKKIPRQKASEIFPITISIDGCVEDYRKDGNGFMLDEIFYIKRQNPELFAYLLEMRSQVGPDRIQSMAVGVTMMHRILRLNAEIDGKLTPQISQSVLDTDKEDYPPKIKLDRETLESDYAREVEYISQKDFNSGYVFDALFLSGFEDEKLYGMPEGFVVMARLLRTMEEREA